MEVVFFNEGNGLFHVSYPIGSRMSNTIDLAEHYVEKLLQQFKINKISDNINIWCRGSSGAILSAIVAVKLQVELRSTVIKICHVKKEGEESHSDSIQIAYGNSVTNIIVDDFSASGCTLNKIYEKASKLLKHGNIDYLCIANGYSKSTIKFVPKTLITSNYVTQF